LDIRDFRESDLLVLIDLTIEAFRPLFERHWPNLMSREVFAHDHAEWESGYRQEVPTLHNPDGHRFITVAEEEGRVLGYVGWNITDGNSGRLEMVAVHPRSQGCGVGLALCRDVLERLKAQGVVVVHVGTGGDDFHARARRLYESLGFTGLPVVDYTKAL
jgi:ribosomal protein S18 acetylase RimI-like enzyme